MTAQERDSVQLVFRAAADNLQQARDMMQKHDLTAEQAKTIINKLAYIFETVANTYPDITSKDAIERAVWCAYNKI